MAAGEQAKENQKHEHPIGHFPRPAKGGKYGHTKDGEPAKDGHSGPQSALAVLPPMEEDMDDGMARQRTNPGDTEQQVEAEQGEEDSQRKTRRTSPSIRRNSVLRGTAGVAVSSLVGSTFGTMTVTGVGLSIAVPVFSLFPVTGLA